MACLGIDRTNDKAVQIYAFKYLGEVVGQWVNGAASNDQICTKWFPRVILCRFCAGLSILCEKWMVAVPL